MLAIAALSARPLVEAAARDGLGTVALDVFGDQDTRALASAWHPIGAEDDPLQISADRLVQALAALARQGGVRGWIPGSGLEGLPDALAEGARRLPFFGTAPEAVRALRDPRGFFRALQAMDVPHPPVAFEPPADPRGWLRKDALGCGGWQVQRAWQLPPAADEPPRSPGHYWQRERPGVPMSATFIANGRDAVVLGFNRQRVQAMGPLPYCFSGILGPVPLQPRWQRGVVRAVQALARRFELRGLGSLDLLLGPEGCEVLELNPRPPASVALYPRVGQSGPILAHLRACETGELPPAPPLDAGAAGPVRGHAILYAPQAMAIGPRRAEAIGRFEGARDRPGPGVTIGAGDPLCSLVAEMARAEGASAGAADADGADAAVDALERTLEQRQRQLLALLESLDD